MSSRGSFFGIEIGRTGLSTAQFGLDTTGHNIANVDTAGYTRQRIVSTAYDPYATVGRFAPVPGHQLVGGGVRVQILDQIRSAYLDRRFRTESTAHAYWDTRSQSLSYIQSFFDNVNEKTSINTSLAEFFRSMKVLEGDTISGAPRTLMQTTAMDMVQQLNMIYDGLIDLQQSENRAVQTKTNDINMIAKDIAELNKQIYSFEVTGMLANDLRDKRNLLVDQLAEYIDIEYDEYPDPTNPSQDMFKIIVAGVTLVDHDYTTEIGTFRSPNPIAELSGNPDYDVYQVVWKYPVSENDKSYDPFDPNTHYKYKLLDWSLVEGGQLKAHVDVRDGNETRITGVFNDPLYNARIPGPPEIPAQFIAGEYEQVATADGRYRGIPYYVEMVNALARALVQEVNQIHRQGWSDHPLGSKTGINFFNEEPEWVTWKDNAGNEFEWDESITFTFTDPVTLNVITVTGGWTDGAGIVARHPDTGEFIDGTGTPITFYDADFDFQGNPPPGSFYRILDITKITAKNIDLSWDIKDSAYNIAASTEKIVRAGMNDPLDPDDPLNTQRGNNVNIQKLYELFSRTDIIGTRLDGNGDPKRFTIGSFDDYGTVIRFDLGNTLHTAQQTRETCRILLLAANNQRTAVAGVSLDEEMVGLVRYTHAYNGASRVITAMDDALDRLINGTGRVGL